MQGLKGFPNIIIACKRPDRLKYKGLSKVSASFSMKKTSSKRKKKRETKRRLRRTGAFISSFSKTGKKANLGKSATRREFIKRHSERGDVLRRRGSTGWVSRVAPCLRNGKATLALKGNILSAISKCKSPWPGMRVPLRRRRQLAMTVKVRSRYKLRWFIKEKN